MASIKKHIKQEVRAKFGDITVYNPNNKQRKELIQMIVDNTRISNGVIQGEFGLEMIRKMLKELTNINNKEIDALSDDELDKLSDLADNYLYSVFNELEAILTEVTQKVASDTVRDLRRIVDGIKELNNLEELGQTIKDFDETCKENNINLSFNDLVK